MAHTDSPVLCQLKMTCTRKPMKGLNGMKALSGCLIPNWPQFMASSRGKVRFQGVLPSTLYLSKLRFSSSLRKVWVQNLYSLVSWTFSSQCQENEWVQRQPHDLGSYHSFNSQKIDCFAIKEFLEVMTTGLSQMCLSVIILTLSFQHYTPIFQYNNLRSERKLLFKFKGGGGNASVQAQHQWMTATASTTNFLKDTKPRLPKMLYM